MAWRTWLPLRPVSCFGGHEKSSSPEREVSAENVESRTWPVVWMAATMALMLFCKENPEQNPRVERPLA